MFLKISWQTLVRKLLILVLGLMILKLSFSDGVEKVATAIDLRAALLVFIMPICVFGFFSQDSIQWKKGLGRILEARVFRTSALRRQLLENTSAVLGPYAHSATLALTQDHPDSFMRFAGRVVLSHYTEAETEELLRNRIENEDEAWLQLGEVLAFLAKMAPYFGMLATVIGMVKLLEQMNDMSKISGGMALAMQGTLYGLISFTMLYSPLLKLVQGIRESYRVRNEMIARWFLMVIARKDRPYIQAYLDSLHLRQEKDSNRSTREVLSGLGSFSGTGN